MIEDSESAGALLKSVLIELDGVFDSELMEDIWVLIESSEMSVAFEILCTNLDESSVAVSERVRGVLEEVGRYLEVDSSYWSNIQLKEQ